MEYHGFGIISEGIESNAHYIIAGVQGDWTRGLVNDPPKFLYTREMKVRARSPCCTLHASLTNRRTVRRPPVPRALLPPRHRDLHGLRHRRGALDDGAARQLVPDLDRL